MVVVKKTGANLTDTYDVSASFQEMTQWYTDTMPTDTSNSPVNRCYEWMAISDAVGTKCII